MDIPSVFASPETMKRFQQETGANYMLIGDITSIVDQEGGDKVKYYQVNLELVDIETNRKAWLGVLIGSLAGTRVLMKAKTALLRKVFAFVILALAVEMIYNALTGGF